MLLDFGARQVFQLVVELMYAELGGCSRIVRKHFLIHKVVRQSVPGIGWGDLSSAACESSKQRETGE